jgi:hypothetical protein
MTSATCLPCPTWDRGHSRRGNALVITMIVMASIVTMFTLAAENMIGWTKLAKVDLDRQRATYAAESIASLIEAKLHERSADLRNLKTDIDEDPTAWWDLVGCCYTRRDGAGSETHVKADRGLWINGCVVRWRLEPVKIYDKTLSDTEPPSGSIYSVNPEPDANLDTKRTDDAIAADPDNTLSDQNEFYHYRIVAEAYALAEGADENAQPWDNPEERACCVQVQRISQLKVTTLFKYAYFHAAEGPTGDISQTGWLQVFKGSIHSNGAIYCGGNGCTGQTACNPYDYHHMASGDAPSKLGILDVAMNTNFGTAQKKITVTGVDGVFRLNKWANYSAVRDGVPFASKNPWKIPTDSTVWSEPRFILNSDYYTGPSFGVDWWWEYDRVKINGIIMPPENDSRKPKDQQKRFNNRVRDKNNHGKIVKTLSNFPALAGRPLEAQHIGSSSMQLYQKSDGTRTVYGGGDALPLYYSSDPSAMTGPASVQTIPVTQWPVCATDMPLFWNDASYTATDISAPPAQDNDFGIGDTFPDREAKGYYLEKALFGKNITSKDYYTALPNPPILGSTGLVIREKATQSPVIAKPSSSDLAAYADYMKSQYVVLFGGHNITAEFFGSMVQQVAATDAVWVEDSLPAGALSSGVYDDPNFSWFGHTGYHEEPWDWFSANTGNAAIQFTSNANYRQQLFFNATDTLQINVGDTLVTYVYLDPKDTPAEIGILYFDGTAWNGFAHWGPDYFGWGTDCGALPAAGQWVRLEVPASVLGNEGATISGLALVKIAGRCAWDTIGTQNHTWVDDELPAGASGWPADAITEPWTIRCAPPAYSGSSASPGDSYANIHQHYFWNVANRMKPGLGEKLFAYVWLDPADLPQQLMLQYYNEVTTSWEHRIYWGANNGSIAGQLAYMGPLPAAGQWVRLEFPASLLSLENAEISGFAFTMFGGGGGSVDRIGTTAVQVDLMVSEDEFINARESGYMASFYGINPTDFPAGSGRSYKVTTLTLNLRKIQDWLRTTLMNEDLGLSEFPVGTLAKSCFNGLIYASRTRRSQTYHPLNHPELYWDPNVLPNSSKYSVAPYANGLFPYQIREGNGPTETFHHAVRIRGGLSKDGSERANHGDVDWNHDTNNDGVDDPAPLGTSGLTVVTPNSMYLWGDYNTTKHPDGSGTDQITPCAIMADMVFWLSANWRDETRQVYANNLPSVWDYMGGHVPCTYRLDEPACSTDYITSFVVNNIPCDDWNLIEFGEVGGAGSILENWRNPYNNAASHGFTMTNMKGSYVVLNKTRYTKGMISCFPSKYNNWARNWESDDRVMEFNTDLFKQDGQPPFSPFGIEVTHVVNTVNIIDN